MNGNKRIAMLHLTSLRWLLGLMVLALPHFLTAQLLSYALDIPEIQGGLQRDGFEEQIHITSFSYGISREEPAGGNRSTLTQGCFLLGKNTDRATPFLFQAVTNNTVFKEMTLTAFQDNLGQYGTIITYKLTNVVVKKWETGAENGETIEEVIGLVPAEINIKYTELEDDGSPGDEFEYTYDFATGS